MARWHSLGLIIAVLSISAGKTASEILFRYTQAVFKSSRSSYSHLLSVQMCAPGLPASGILCFPAGNTQ